MSEIEPSAWTYRCGDNMPWTITSYEPEWEPGIEVLPLYDEAALAKARAEAIEECRNAYGAHYHNATGEDGDWCAECGENFRHPIHLRMDESRKDRIRALSDERTEQ